MGMYNNDPTEGIFNRNREYDGQPHTDHGKRGQVELRLDDPFRDVARRSDRPYNPKMITLRDIYDAVLIGMCSAYGVNPESLKDMDDLYDRLDFNGSSFDPVAAAQNASVEIEKRLGIYPNISELLYTEPN
jgi:hypothetical protein